MRKRTVYIYINSAKKVHLEYAMTILSDHQVRLIRIQSNGLYPRWSRKQLVMAVSSVCGIQAQSNPAMLLALRARIEGLTIDEVTRAMGKEPSLVRSWLMRGTMHLVTAKDFHWMNGLFGPLFAPKGRRRRLELGLTDDVCTRGLDAIRDILYKEPLLTRGDLVEQLAKRRIKLDRATQGPIHLIGLAAHEGILCIGPDNEDGENTYTLIDDWLEPQPEIDREQALTLLAHFYIGGYGPASLADFAGWSGLPKAEAKIGWDGAIASGDHAEIQVGDKTLYAIVARVKAVKESSEPIVRLLPAFDALILGYSDRDLLVEPRHQKEIYHGGQTVPAVLVNGLVAGTWRYQRKGKRMEVRIKAFDSFDSQVMDGIEAEVKDIGRFFDLPATLVAET
jgi:hypothetical protein